MRAPLIECPPPALQRAGTSRWGSRCRPRECGGCGGEAPCAAAPPRGSRSAPTRPERGSAQKCARVRVRSFRESPLRAESSPDAKWRGPLERLSVSRAPRRRGLRNRHPSAPRASARWRKSRPRPARSARTGRRPCRARGSRLIASPSPVPSVACAYALPARARTCSLLPRRAKLRPSAARVPRRAAPAATRPRLCASPAARTCTRVGCGRRLAPTCEGQGVHPSAFVVQELGSNLRKTGPRIFVRQHGDVVAQNDSYMRLKSSY